MTDETFDGEARSEQGAPPPPDETQGEQPEGSGFEESVKGIGQGIAGKFKEMLGEFFGDPNLEQEGIVQQLDGRIRRSEAQRPPSGEQPTP